MDKKIIITEEQYKSLHHLNENLEDAIYYGVFIDEKSKNTIRKVFGIPEGWTEYNDHITIAFKPTIDSEDGKWMQANLGKKIPIMVRTIGNNGKALALGVECKIPCNNEHMHLTIACAEGVKPIESNNIEDWQPTRPFLMFGTIGYFSNDGVMFEGKKVNYQKTLTENQFHNILENAINETIKESFLNENSDNFDEFIDILNNNGWTFTDYKKVRNWRGKTGIQFNLSKHPQNRYRIKPISVDVIEQKLKNNLGKTINIAKRGNNPQMENSTVILYDN